MVRRGRHGLRNLGLTVAEIRELAGVYVDEPGEPIGPRLAERLAEARSRIDDGIAELTALRKRIDDFEARHGAELSGSGGADFRATDPTASRLDSAPGGTVHVQRRR